MTATNAPGAASMRDGEISDIGLVKAAMLARRTKMDGLVVHYLSYSHA